MRGDTGIGGLARVPDLSGFVGRRHHAAADETGQASDRHAQKSTPTGLPTIDLTLDHDIEYKALFLSDTLSNKASTRAPGMNWNKFAFEYKLETEGILSDVISIEAHKQSALLSN